MLKNFGREFVFFHYFLFSHVFKNIRRNKVIENSPKTPQNVSAKTTTEPSDKTDLTVKSVTNVDKLVSGAVIKKPYG